MRAIFTLITLALFTLVAPTANAQSYTITDLGTFSPIHINSKAQVAGTNSTATPVQAVIWSNGTSKALPPLVSGQPTYGYDINDLGFVCGVAYNAAGKGQAVKWEGTNLVTIAGAPSVANGINKAGDVAAKEQYSDFDGNLYIYAALRLASGDEVFPWGKGNNYISSATSINTNGDDTGYVIIPGLTGSFGYFDIPSSGDQPVTFRLAGDTRTLPRRINDTRQIVGESSGTGPTKAFFWQSGHGISLPPLAAGLNASAYDINNSGQVVGWASSSDNLQQAVLWQKNNAGDWTITDLKTLLPGDSGWTNLTIATGINNSGQIVGTGVNPQGQTDAFLLTPANPTLTVTTETSTYYISNVPVMPTVKAAVKVNGVTPDPTATTQFTWTYTVHYNPAESGNAHGPNKNIDYTWPVSKPVTSGAFTPDFKDASSKIVLRGGTLSLIAQATINGKVVKSNPVKILILGNNPAASTVENALVLNGMPSYVLAQIATKESHVRQFDAATHYPLWSSDNLGGVGIMQVTNPAPTNAQVWDWRQNVQAGINKIISAEASSDNLPSNIMNPTYAPRFKTLVDNYNAKRAALNPPKPPLTITVPDLPDGDFNHNPNFYEKNVIRYYNGAAGEDPVTELVNGSGVHYLPEYTIKTNSDGTLYVTNIDETKHTGGTAWVQVDWHTRPNVGDPNYVNDVLKQTPP